MSRAVNKQKGYEEKMTYLNIELFTGRFKAGPSFINT